MAETNTENIDLKGRFYIAKSIICEQPTGWSRLFNRDEIGLFSRFNISSGSIIGEYEGHDIPRRIFLEEYDLDRTFVVEGFTKNGIQMVRIGTNMLRFANHHHDPNITFRPNSHMMVAIKDINEGDEISWAYQSDKNGQNLPYERLDESLKR